MTKKRVGRKGAGGRGGRRKTAARARAPTKSDRVLLDKDNQENVNHFFDDEQPYVKKRAVPSSRRGRGRPKNSVSQVELRSATNPPGVMYIPGKYGKHYGRQLVPVTSPKMTKQAAAVTPVARSVVEHSLCHRRAVRSRAVTTHPVSFMQQPIRVSACEKNDQQDNWPEDLRDLIEKWDDLPGRWRETILWLKAPLIPKKLPTMVSNLQKMIAEWDETYDNKVRQILDWLDYTPEANFQVPQPKVIVEAQPSPIQVCGQWSSMTEIRETCETNPCCAV